MIVYRKTVVFACEVVKFVFGCAIQFYQRAFAVNVKRGFRTRNGDILFARAVAFGADVTVPVDIVAVCALNRVPRQLKSTVRVYNALDGGNTKFMLYRKRYYNGLIQLDIIFRFCVVPQSDIVHRRVAPHFNLVFNSVALLCIGRENSADRGNGERCRSLLVKHVACVKLALLCAGGVCVNGHYITRTYVVFRFIPALFEFELKALGRRNVIQRHNIVVFRVVVSLFDVRGGNSRAVVLDNAAV